jgi:hypothetical protein
MGGGPILKCVFGTVPVKDNAGPNNQQFWNKGVARSDDIRCSMPEIVSPLFLLVGLFQLDVKQCGCR